MFTALVNLLGFRSKASRRAPLPSRNSRSSYRPTIDELETRIVPAIYMQYEGVPGESEPATSPKATIEVKSYQFGIQKTNSAQPGAGKPQVQDILINKPPSKPVLAMPWDPLDINPGSLPPGVGPLSSYAGPGKHIDDGLIAGAQTGGNQQAYLAIYLENTLVSSFSVSGGSSSDRPMESISFNF